MHCFATSICFWINSIFEETLQALVLSFKEKKDYAKPLNHTYAKEGSVTVKELKEYAKSVEINTLSTAAPYFFPFTIEFSILVISVWILMMENIRNTEHNVYKFSTKKKFKKMTNPIGKIHIDCSNSSIGLFLGLLSIIAAVIATIFFFTNNDDVGKVCIPNICILYV